MLAQTSILILYCQGYTHSVKTTNVGVGIIAVGGLHMSLKLQIPTVGSNNVHHAPRYWDGLQKGLDGTSMCNIFHIRIRFRKVHHCIQVCVECIRSIQYPGSAGRMFVLDSGA
ncbi:uncharacterized protein EV420DRAFT_1486003 [Desarmillaria tabescens]|uniref:Uncharacterized protein n=1 Tax=Armillaria tabescens TaxID=1929756 RepID=A0AA39JFL6_ARMTA|nr:uncharacterized protein EV420DRAFT_1486003 [Desarmillaria tabescens]KAK0440439.1 hypothetical protein EV420DRAFT_1486003 [Desarmillaria tabescens]